MKSQFELLNEGLFIFDKSNRDIYIYDSNREKPKRITSHPKVDYNATFSPDGKQILFNNAA